MQERRNTMSKKFGIALCAACIIGAGVMLYAIRPAAATWIEPVTGMEFVWVEGGCFEMGMTTEEEAALRAAVPQRFYDKRFADEPRRTACPEGFWISRGEVTQGQWAAVTGQADQACLATRNPANPVSWVTHGEAVAFARLLAQQHNGTQRFTLPTEAQWEKACRQDAVASLGLTGMLVAPEEWVDTFYTENGTAPVVEEPDAPRVLKGDRCTGREPATPNYINCNVSFRLVRLAGPEQ